jgi:hypothetical protein
MPKYQDMYDAHQRARFMRPDAARYIRPDVARFLRPGTDPAEDGELRGHFWDGPHREYKDAVMELSNRFLRDHDIMETSRMTPAQAQDLLAEIRRSENPAIRDFNRAMRLIGRNFRLRFGRGNQ